MKFTLIIDEEREEEVVVYARAKSKFTEELEAFVLSGVPELIGYGGKNIVKLSLAEVFAFSVEEGKTFAIMENEKLWVQKRLYRIEELEDARFVKVNQSCLVNVCKIERFEATLGGSLMVVLKNGYRDYVSRRQMKKVKERIGFKR